MNTFQGRVYQDTRGCLTLAVTHLGEVVHAAAKPPGAKRLPPQGNCIASTRCPTVAGVVAWFEDITNHDTSTPN